MQFLLAGIGLLAAVAAFGADEMPEGQDLTQLSLEQLANLEVTSVSKSAEPLRQATAAIYVITHDDIVRSGATSIGEALRLAPNLTITQLSASNYGMAARGFASNPADQSFSNKLLLLIDGRSVYSPLFSGIYLDAQDVMLQDVDRIEVISGPGATLWGANAVNGVINIITRPAYLTDGTLLSAGGGNLEQDLAARYGGKLDAETAYRVYAKSFQHGSLEQPNGTSAHDNWYKTQGGFRLDRSLDADTLTAQGDMYRALENQANQGDGMVSGANLLARWEHHSGRSDLQLQGYFDQTENFSPYGGSAFVLHTYDLQFQQTFAASAAQHLVWGAGERIYSYSITNTSAFLFEPPDRELTLENLFAQDTIAFGRLKFTGGIKLENDPYAGWQFQPDARVAWEWSDSELLWVAASRAVRSPTPFDVDVIEKLGGIVYLKGNGGFRPERVTAYELGYRGRPADTLTLSVSAFYNVYDDLRSIEPTSTTLLIPFEWANMLRGHTYGVGAWAQWQAFDWWRLSPGMRTLHKDLNFRPGSSELLGVAQAGDDPTTQLTLTSSMDLGRKLTLDATLRRVGALPSPALPAYTELSARIGWRVSPSLELSLNGSNLLHARHMEFPAPIGAEIQRSFFLQAEWKR